jgi:hypothetical protein
LVFGISLLYARQFIAMAALLRSPDSLNAYINMPGIRPNDAWARAGFWCRNNTPKDALFIVPPFSRFFRVYSERSILANMKDGTKLLFSEDFAIEWSERMADLRTFDSFNEDDFRKLKSKYNASYAVIRNNNSLRFPILYSNEDYNIYHIE